MNTATEAFASLQHVNDYWLGRLRERIGSAGEEHNWGDVGDQNEVHRKLMELAEFVLAAEDTAGSLRVGDWFRHPHYGWYALVHDLDFVSPGVMSDEHDGGVRIEWEHPVHPKMGDDSYWLDPATPLSIIRGDGSVATKYEVEERPVTDQLWITHTFKVPVENMGGQNHGPEQWVADALSVAGLWDDEVAEDDGMDGEKLHFTEVGAHWHVTLVATERALRFLCVLFDLHAEQSPSDSTDPAEATRMERTIREAQILAGPPSPERARLLYEKNGWLTVGKMREAIANKPDDMLITIYDGAWYKHAEIVSDVRMPGGDTDPTMILGMTTEFDTRDI